MKSEQLLFVGVIAAVIVSVGVYNTNGLSTASNVDQGAAVAMSGVQVKDITTTSARVAFLTNVKAYGAVCYSISNTQKRILDNCKKSDGLSITHGVLLSGLKPSTKYYFIVKATVNSRATLSSVQSFKTLGLVSTSTEPEPIPPTPPVVSTTTASSTL